MVKMIVKTVQTKAMHAKKEDVDINNFGAAAVNVLTNDGFVMAIEIVTMVMTNILATTLNDQKNNCTIMCVCVYIYI